MLHRMPKPGDVIQQLFDGDEVGDEKIFVLSCSGEVINRQRDVDHSRCLIEALKGDGSRQSKRIIFYDNWFFLIDSDVSNINNISEE